MKTTEKRKTVDIVRSMLGTTALAMVLCASAVYAQAQGQGGGQNPSADQSHNGSPQGSPAGHGADSKAASADKLSKGDLLMIKDLAQANLSEIAAARLAKETSKDDQVQSFAQKIIDDHTAASQRLQELASEKGVELPTALDKKHEAALDKLRKLSGDQFDKKYIRQEGVQDHRQARQMLLRIQKQAADQDLKDYAANLLPIIVEHRDLALKLKGENAAVATSGSSGDAGRTIGNAGSSASVTGRPPANTVDLGNSNGSSGKSGAHNASGASGSSGTAGSGK